MGPRPRHTPEVDTFVRENLEWAPRLAIAEMIVKSDSRIKNFPMTVTVTKDSVTGQFMFMTIRVEAKRIRFSEARAIAKDLNYLLREKAVGIRVTIGPPQLE